MINQKYKNQNNQQLRDENSSMNQVTSLHKKLKDKQIYGRYQEADGMSTDCCINRRSQYKKLKGSSVECYYSLAEN